MTLNKAYSLPSFLSLTPPLFLCSSQPYPPPERGQVARTWGGGIGRLHAEIDYPSNLRTASLSPGPNCSMNSTPPPPPPQPPLPPTPTLSLMLYLLSPLSSIPFVPPSLCCQRHWGTTLSHSPRQGHSLAVPALFTICHGKWGSCGL